MVSDTIRFNVAIVAVLVVDTYILKLLRIRWYYEIYVSKVTNHAPHLSFAIIRNDEAINFSQIFGQSQAHDPRRTIKRGYAAKLPHPKKRTIALYFGRQFVNYFIIIRSMSKVKC